MNKEELIRNAQPDNPMFWFPRVDKLVKDIEEVMSDDCAPIGPNDLISAAMVEAYKKGFEDGIVDTNEKLGYNR